MWNRFAPRHTTGSPPQGVVDIGPDAPSAPAWLDAIKPIGFVAAAGGVFPGEYNNPIWGPIGPATARALWISPIFDLRPDISGNYRPTATPIPGAARLHVQVFNTDGTLIQDLPSTLEVFSVEFAAPTNPDELRAIQERLDITADFFSGTASSLLEWAPVGAPIRFWRVAMVFDWTDAVAAAPNSLFTFASAH